MRCMMFAALVLGGVPRGAGAQRVPARDLLDFRLGTLAEAPALARTVGDGMWNPAVIALDTGLRGRVAGAVLSTGADQGVSAQGIVAALSGPLGATYGLAAIRAGVRDIVPTSTDPQTVGGPLGYATTLLSVLGARRIGRVTGGVAMRYRIGELDMQREGRLAADAGVLVDRLGRFDGRVAAASFLFNPGAAREERPALSAAADLRVAGGAAEREVRAGYALVATSGLGREQYALASGRSGRFAARGGVTRSSSLGVVTWGSRLGIGLHHARYVAAIAREESDGGLPPSYQFTLSTTFP